MALLDPIIYGSHYTTSSTPTPQTAASVPQGPRATGQQPSRPGFGPKFDVHEMATEYVLVGEFPGLSDKSKLDIQFTDHKTLLIRGTLEPSPIIGTPEAIQKGAFKETTAPVSPRSLKPTVEDTEDESDTASTFSADEFEVVHKPSTKKADSVRSPSPSPPPTEKKPLAEKKPINKTEQSKVWVSERAFGPFQRTFSFPGFIDIENVSASLECGLLRVVVPKKTQSAARKIVVG